MKNLIPFFFYTLLSINSFSQLNLSPLGVGINKIAPTVGLAVKGGNGGNINIDNNGEQYNDIDFLYNGTRKALLGLDNVSNLFRIVSERNDQDFSIQTGGFNERFRIKSTGQIGIGMQAWQDYKVSINADDVLHPFILYNNKNQLSYVDFWNGSNDNNAGISNRFVTTKPNSNDMNAASIDKYRNGLWAFRNYDSNGKIEFDLQGIVGNNTPELIIENDGGVKIPSAGIKFGGTPVAGSLRWTGSDFEGYNGSQWKSLLNNQLPPQSYWATASSSANCQNVCGAGYAPAADSQGRACSGTGTGYGSGTYFRNLGNQENPPGWYCNSGGLLAQCHCIKITP